MLSRLLLITIICCQLRAETCTTTKVLGKCDNALSACQDLVQTQDTAITHLKEGNKELEKKLESDNAPWVPWYVWAGAGLVAGMVAGVKIAK